MCLDRCRTHDSPLPYLVEYVEELRQAGWREFDLRVVEKAAVRMLGVIIDPVQGTDVVCPNCNWREPVVLLREAEETIFYCSDCHHQWQVATTG